MKICWDNLEKIIYRPDRGEWQDKKHPSVFYIYKKSCKNCGEPFFAIKWTSKSLFCDISCSVNGENHHMYGKHHTEETKKKQSISMKSKISGNWKGGITENNLPFYNTYAHQISYCEEVRRNIKDQNILEVKCAYCGKWYIPLMISVQNRVQTLNGNYCGEQRLYCSDNCKQECPIYKKHKWPAGFKPATSREVQPELRQMCLKRDNYTCQKCGLTQDELDTGLHCHHIEGIRWVPLESADLDKVITFCKNCHIEVHKQSDCGYHDMRCNGGV